MKKEILFITATHGDEPIGVEVVQDVEGKRKNFDWIIGNPKALERGVRYCGKDLNRSAPGNADSSVYEEARAAEIIELSRKYLYTIDIHGTTKNTGIFILITNPTEQNLKIATLLDIPRIVIWSSITDEQKCPMSEFFSCGLEIECGEKDDPKIRERLTLILIDFLSSYKENEQEDWKERLKQKQIFQMYGSLKKSDCTDPLQLKEFREVDIGNETFTPVFIGSYDYHDVLCYKLRKISPEQIVFPS